MHRQRAPGTLFAAAVLITSLLAVQPPALGARHQGESGGRPSTAAEPNAPGDELWVAHYNEGSGDVATALEVSPDGSRVFVTGSSPPLSEFIPDYATVAYDASSGAELWAARYSGSADSGWDEPAALGVSPDGSTVFVTGHSESGPRTDNYNWATVAYDASTGDELWVRRYNFSGNSRARDLGVSRDGSTVFVTGSADGPDPGSATVAYDVATGLKRWVRRSAGIATYVVGVSPDVVFVTGQDEQDFVTVAYSASSGAVLWGRRYNGGSFSYANALGVSPGGSTVFVGGRSGPYFATVAYRASSGVQLWDKIYVPPGTASQDGVKAIGVSPDGSTVFVAGGSGPEWPFDYTYLTVAYDAATGVQRWARLYGRAGSGDATALGVSPDSSTVFVTGFNGGWPCAYDYATLAYDAATGVRLGVRRYDGGVECAVANGLGVSPDGSKVFVTGGAGEIDVNFTTVAYSTR